MMSTLRPAFIGLALMAGHVAAEEELSDQQRLAVLELRLGLTKAQGLGERHPLMLRLDSDIRAIEARNPAVRDRGYVDLLKGNRARLEEEHSRRIEAGLGESHPVVVEIAGQLSEIRRRLEKAGG